MRSLEWRRDARAQSHRYSEDSADDSSAALRLEIPNKLDLESSDGAL